MDKQTTSSIVSVLERLFPGMEVGCDSLPLGAGYGLTLYYRTEIKSSLVVDKWEDELTKVISEFEEMFEKSDWFKDKQMAFDSEIVTMKEERLKLEYDLGEAKKENEELKPYKIYYDLALKMKHGGVND